MITREVFSKMDAEIKNSVIEAFEYIKNNCREDNYILFLANGEFDDKSFPKGSGNNPHSMDNRIDGYKDESRINFFIQFMKTFYSFPTGIDYVDDDDFRITLELMIYSHIWESKNLLKQLYRISSLVLDKPFPWVVNVPEMSKHIFIRNDIRDSLRSNKLSLSEIITKVFHTSLRNAFAHSEYSLNKTSKKITLHTYKGDGSWDIPSITYDDWSKRFTYTTMLSFYLMKYKQEYRENVVKDFNKSEFLISHPLDLGRTKYRRIYYDIEHDLFRFR
jgi:hypothetical protein